MKIKDMWDKRRSLEIDIDELGHTVSNRWRILTGYECVVVEWCVGEEMIQIDYYYEPDWRVEDKYTIDVPVRFFEMEDDQEARKAWDKYWQEIKDQDQDLDEKYLLCEKLVSEL